MAKSYTKPVVKTEKLKFGVFGDYGCSPNQWRRRKRRRFMWFF